MWNNNLIKCSRKIILTLSDSDNSASLSIRSYTEIRLLTCQFKPLSDAAMLDAAMLLAEYVEKSCSVKKNKNY